MKLLFPTRILVPVFLLLFPAIQYAQNEAIPRFNPPKQYYLALGDSLAFGSQQINFNANFPVEPPSAFNTGYVDDLAVMLRGIRPDIQTVNFGCPGEEPPWNLIEGAQVDASQVGSAARAGHRQSLPTNSSLTLHAV